MFDSKSVADMVHTAVALMPTKARILGPHYAFSGPRFQLKSDDYNITVVYTYIDSLQTIIFVIYLSDLEDRLRMYRVYKMTVYADMFLAVNDNELADFGDLLEFMEDMILSARDFASIGRLHYLKSRSYGIVECTREEAMTVSPIASIVGL